MPAFAVQFALLALLAAPEAGYLWPTEVVVCTEADDEGASEWARTLLPRQVAIRVLTPAEWLVDRAPTPLTLVRRSALSDERAEAAVERSLQRGRAVVLAEGMAPATRLLGLEAVPLPRGWREVVDTRSPAPRLEAVPPEVVVRPSCAALRDARADALRQVGRSEPEGAAGLSLRWTAGPREGARLVIAPLTTTHDLARCLAWADAPLLTRAECDYALVREGEDLRVVIAGAAREGSALRLRLAVTSPSGGPTWHTTLDLPEPGDAGSDSRLARLSHEQIIPGRAWRAPSIGLRAELLSRGGTLLDRIETRAIVEPLQAPTGRLPVPTVTRRRLALARGSAPAFGVEVGPSLTSLPSAPEARTDMAGWEGLLTTLRDTGCAIVSVPALITEPHTEPEFRRRANRARTLSALRVGITPELLLNQPISPEELLGDANSGPSLAGSVLVRPAGLFAADEAGWPVTRTVPPPIDLPVGGWLPLAAETRCVAGLAPVRARGPVLSSTALWASLALGDAGHVLDARDGATDLSRLLEATLLSRALAPGATAQRVGLLLSGPDDAWADDAAEQLDRAGYEWSPWLVEATHDWPGSTRALVLASAEGLGEGPLSHLAAWLDVGGSVVAPAEDLTRLARDATGPDLWRVGRGTFAAWDRGAPSSLPAALLALGLEPLTTARPPLARALRNTAGDGGELVCLFPRSGHPSPARLPVAGHTVEVGCAPGEPVAASGTSDGPWMATGLGSIVIDGTTLLLGDGACRLTAVSLDGAPLLSSRNVLVFLDGTDEVVVTGPLGQQRDLAPYATHCAASEVLLSRRPAQRAGEALRVPSHADSAGRPLVLAPPDSVATAQRRLGELLWGRR